jgi:hypothetical protein
VLGLCDTDAWEIDSTGHEIRLSFAGQKVFKVSDKASIALPVFREMFLEPERKVLSDHLNGLFSNGKAFCDEVFLKDLTCIRIKGIAINRDNISRFLGTVQVLLSAPKPSPQSPNNKYIRKVL